MPDAGGSIYDDPNADNSVAVPETGRWSERQGRWIPTPRAADDTDYRIKRFVEDSGDVRTPGRPKPGQGQVLDHDEYWSSHATSSTRPAPRPAVDPYWSDPIPADESMADPYWSSTPTPPPPMPPRLKRPARPPMSAPPISPMPPPARRAPREEPPARREQRREERREEPPARREERRDEPLRRREPRGEPGRPEARGEPGRPEAPRRNPERALREDEPRPGEARPWEPSAPPSRELSQTGPSYDSYRRGAGPWTPEPEREVAPAGDRWKARSSGPDLYAKADDYDSAWDEEDDEDEEDVKPQPVNYVSAAVAALTWFVLPVLIYLGYAFSLDDKTPPGCKNSAAAECRTPRAEALHHLFGNVPLIVTVVSISILIALVLRRFASGWRTVTVGFAAAVVGAGAATVLFTVISN
jgi:hypothetical protein